MQTSDYTIHILTSRVTVFTDKELIKVVQRVLVNNQGGTRRTALTMCDTTVRLAVDMGTRCVFLEKLLIEHCAYEMGCKIQCIPTFLFMYQNISMSLSVLPYRAAACSKLRCKSSTVVVHIFYVLHSFSILRLFITQFGFSLFWTYNPKGIKRETEESILHLSFAHLIYMNQETRLVPRMPVCES